jgi:HTH-type transcriptional regulator, competence development regulator
MAFRFVGAGAGAWAQLSKIEKGLRQLKQEQIRIIAEILKVNSDELMTQWLADQIYEVVNDEKPANEAMQVADKILI